jgi:hypothetical protein
MLREVLFALFSIVFGVLLCFYGYRFFMVMLPIWSFFGGFWLGAKGVKLLLGEGFLATATGLTTGLVFGVVLAIFAWQFYHVGVALVGAITGAWLGSGLADVLGFERGSIPVIAAIVGAVLLGGVTYARHWQKYLVMGLSAVGGANSLVLAALLLLGRVSLRSLQGAGTAIDPVLQDSWFWLLLWLVLAIAGVLVQLRSYRETTFAKAEFVKYCS